MRYIITALILLYSLFGFGQEVKMPENALMSRQVFFDDLQYQRVPNVIVESWDKLRSKSDTKVVYDNPALRIPKESVCYIYTSKTKAGYLHVNKTIELTMDSTDMRKVEYYLNEQIVNDYKLAKKLFKLEMRDIQSLNIDTAAHLEFVKVYIALKD
ncbi:MAG: hypothetical protein PHD61_08930 [Bacteroidales bacterium]|nr:hypothetical protein [Bacteroidales bacterium]